MLNYSKHVSTKATPQTEQVFGKQQVQNSAGGYVFQLDKWAHLRRFLILGCEGGTYYASERKLTVDAAKCVLACAEENPARAVNEISSISREGRAPKNDPAIFALAMLCSHEKEDIRKAAYLAVGAVCRIGTHLFQFAEMVQGMRGWGRGLRRTIASWYLARSPQSLSMQVTKYKQRNGWSHADLLRLAHPKRADEAHADIFKYVLGKDIPIDNHLIAAVEEVQGADKESIVVDAILKHGLVREHIPTQWLNSVAVWEALLKDMPMTAMIRNLGKMSSIGMLNDLSANAKSITDRLVNQSMLNEARIHPLAVLMALSVYRQGHGEKGKLSWTPNQQICNALEQAFHLAFGNVVPSGKNIMIGLDVSGSMAGGGIAGTSITPREASAAMCMVTARTEPAHMIYAFSNTFMPLDITASDSLSSVMRKTAGLPFAGTDCSLPMLHATKQKLQVDTFIVYTDSETWAGRVHPFQALQEYRKKLGREAKLIVVGMTASNFTIADPSDAGMLDVVGFDTATPNIISDFSRGDL